MKPENRIYSLYLEDMLLSMERIEEYTNGLDFINFKRDYKTVDAVVRNFEIIGEAAKHIPNDIANKYQDVPWRKMYNLRNIISHEYFGIDYEMIWEIATADLPKNKTSLKHLIEIEKPNWK